MSDEYFFLVKSAYLNAKQALDISADTLTKVLDIANVIPAWLGAMSAWLLK